MTARKIWAGSMLDPGDYPEVSKAFGATMTKAGSMRSIARKFSEQYISHIDLGLRLGEALMEFREDTDFLLTPAQESFLLQYSEAKRGNLDTAERLDSRFELQDNPDESKDRSGWTSFIRGAAGFPQPP